MYSLLCIKGEGEQAPIFWRDLPVECNPEGLEDSFPTLSDQDQPARGDCTGLQMRPQDRNFSQGSDPAG
jgi:hypothetical protein